MRGTLKFLLFAILCLLVGPVVLHAVLQFFPSERDLQGKWIFEASENEWRSGRYPWDAVWEFGPNGNLYVRFGDLSPDCKYEVLSSGRFRLTWPLGRSEIWHFNRYHDCLILTDPDGRVYKCRPLAHNQLT
jgi:hypothetical protein